MTPFVCRLVPYKPCFFSSLASWPTTCIFSSKNIGMISSKGTKTGRGTVLSSRYPEVTLEQWRQLEE